MYVTWTNIRTVREEQGGITNMKLSQIFLAIWSTKLSCSRKPLKFLLEIVALAACGNNMYTHAEN